MINSIKKNSKIAYIGPKEYSMIFSFLGFYCFSVEKKEEFEDTLKNVKEEGFDLIFASQDIVSKETLDIVVLPGIVKKEDKDYLKEEIKRAIGTKLPSIEN